jgi:predicted metalloendopeptidase
LTDIDAVYHSTYYKRNKHAKIEYQKTSPAAKAARDRYKEKHKDRIREQALARARSIEGRLTKMIYAAEARAKIKGLEFDISYDDIKDLPMICPVFKTEMGFSTSGRSPNTPSLDRLDNNKGYTKENTRLISDRANRLKSDGTLEEFKAIIDYIVNNGR